MLYFEKGDNVDKREREETNTTDYTADTGKYLCFFPFENATLPFDYNKKIQN